MSRFTDRMVQRIAQQAQATALVHGLTRPMDRLADAFGGLARATDEAAARVAAVCRQYLESCDSLPEDIWARQVTRLMPAGADLLRRQVAAALPGSFTMSAELYLEPSRKPARGWNSTDVRSYLTPDKWVDLGTVSIEMNHAVGVAELKCRDAIFRDLPAGRRVAGILLFLGFEMIAEQPLLWTEPRGGDGQPLICTGGDLHLNWRGGVAVTL